MRHGSGFLNDGSEQAPRLKVHLNLGNLDDLRPGSVWPGPDGLPGFQKLLFDGFEGVQLTTDDPCVAGAALPHCGLDRVNTPDEADAIAAKHAARGDLCITIHAGWGLENNDDMFALVEAILAASEKHCLPIFIETHRATITQDLWRTVEITKKFPEVRFNGDFSHYYCGQELTYGNWDSKLAFMQPVFDRAGFLHGRIASSGCMQVSIGTSYSSRPSQAYGQVDFLAHFKELWTRSMLGFLRNALPGDILIFAPELLSGAHYYARKFPDASGRLNEESDRYSEALLYKEMACACFADAEQILISERD